LACKLLLGQQVVVIDRVLVRQADQARVARLNLGWGLGLGRQQHIGTGAGIGAIDRPQVVANILAAESPTWFRHANPFGPNQPGASLQKSRGPASGPARFRLQRRERNVGIAGPPLAAVQRHVLAQHPGNNLGDALLASPRKHQV
jgi:hypothetical protein